MEFKILNENEKSIFCDEIFSMLKAADEEFVPPLSSRGSTTQKNLSGSEKSEAGIRKYFEEMMKQHIMVALEDKNLLAFVSYKENYTNEEIGTEYLPNIYLSTLVSKPESRGKGLTKKMYAALFNEYETRNICTRTWSTNAPHIKILDYFGFETLCTLKNHRGEEIDTTYFIKKRM